MNFASSQYILEKSRRDLLVGELLLRSSLSFFRGVMSQEKRAGARLLLQKKYHSNITGPQIGSLNRVLAEIYLVKH